MGDMYRFWGGGEGYTGFLVEKSERNRPLGKPGRKWEDNIKMDLEEMERGLGYEYVCTKGRKPVWL